MHAIKSDLVKPDFLVDLLHGALLLGDHLQFMLHLFKSLRVVGALRLAVFVNDHFFELLCRIDLSRVILALLE